MLSSFPGQSYRALLLEHQGRGFSEVEVTEILRQVLPQLASIHNQGLVHGGISVDNLYQNESNLQAVLVDNQGFATPAYVAPEQMYTGQMSAAGDIYALSVTMLMLLTGQNPEVLRNYDGTWNWQDYCVVSDQFAVVLERGTAVQPQNRYANAMEMLQAINPIPATVGYFPVVNPLPAQPAVLSSDRQVYQQSFSQPLQKRSGLALWLWVLIAIGTSVITALAGFGLMKLTNQADSKTTANNSSVTPRSYPASTTNVTPQPIVSPELNNSTPNEVASPIQPSVSPNSATQNSAPSQPVVSALLPAQSVQIYYSSLNSRQYQTGWNYLSTEFQNNKAVHENGYQSFLEWWTKVKQINIQEVVPVSQNSQEAVVDANLTYVMNKGSVSSESLRYFLGWDATTGKWRIESVKRK
jgi:serine/threonine protein kinase, bacterial